MRQSGRARFAPSTCAPLFRFKADRSAEQPGIELLRYLNVAHAQRDMIQRSTVKGGSGCCVGMRVSHRADRCQSSEKTLNQLLPIERAMLEQSDEILNGILH